MLTMKAQKEINGPKGNKRPKREKKAKKGKKRPKREKKAIINKLVNH